MVRQYELIERVKAYDPNVNEDVLNRAYVFATKAHGSQRRASGDPYFSHPVEVAAILADMRLDTGTIVTALLHDVIEDTVYSRSDIAELFGEEIAALVDGVSKLSQIELQSDQSRQAENFRKLVLAMSDDIRVLLVKLADRLHNMRTLSYVADADKRRRVALETREIYAPLAERMGINDMRDELDGLAFCELQPDAYESVTRRLSALHTQGGDRVALIIEELDSLLAKARIRAQVHGREKQPHSIWRKMQDKAVEFEQLADIIAFRVIVGTKAACYRVLGVLHTRYSVVPGRFKDYISTPKPNGYQSLHTTVIGPLKTRIEIQIRTEKMDNVAERGVAAHWIYKQGASGREGRRYRWIRELLDIMDNALGAEEFLEHTRMNMYSDQVFPFTPKGDVIALPRGATPIDFAYAVHTDIGNTCVGAKINGRLMPLRTRLHNGDQVEIVRGTTPSVTLSWDHFVVTGKARACIRRHARVHQRKEFINLGQAILSKIFSQAKIFDPSKKRARHKPAPSKDTWLISMAKKLGYSELDDVYVAVGSGALTTTQLCHVLALDNTPAPSSREQQAGEQQAGDQHDDAVSVSGPTADMGLHYAPCCTPLPGDKILGIITPGHGVTVHTTNCPHLGPDIPDPQHVISLNWDSNGKNRVPFIGRLSVVLANNTGSLGSLTTVIGAHDSNITNLEITNRSSDFFDMVVDIEVRDLPHLSHIINVLRSNPAVNSVQRHRG